MSHFCHVPTAVFLRLAVLAFLACIAVLVYQYAAYFKGLPREVETLTSIIVLVYAQPCLQTLYMGSADITHASLVMRLAPTLRNYKSKRSTCSPCIHFFYMKMGLNNDDQR